MTFANTACTQPGSIGDDTALIQALERFFACATGLSCTPVPCIPEAGLREGMRPNCARPLDFVAYRYLLCLTSHGTCLRANP